LTDTLYIHICVKHFGMANIKKRSVLDCWQYLKTQHSRYHKILYVINLLHKYLFRP